MEFEPQACLHKTWEELEALGINISKVLVKTHVVDGETHKAFKLCGKELRWSVSLDSYTYISKYEFCFSSCGRSRLWVSRMFDSRANPARHTSDDIFFWNSEGDGWRDTYVQLLIDFKDGRARKNHTILEILNVNVYPAIDMNAQWN